MIDLKDETMLRAWLVGQILPSLIARQLGWDWDQEVKMAIKYADEVIKQFRAEGR